MADTVAAPAPHVCTCPNPSNVAHLCSGGCQPTTSLAERCFTVVYNEANVASFSMQPLLDRPALLMNVAQRLLGEIIDSPRFPEEKPTHVLAFEGSGSFLGTWIAYSLDVPLVPVSRRGRATRLVPDEDDANLLHVVHGEQCVYFQKNHLPAGARCLVVDGVLAEGGAMRAAHAAVEACGATVTACVVLLHVSDTCPWMNVPVIGGFIVPQTPAEPPLEYFNVLPLDTRRELETRDERRARELE